MSAQFFGGTLSSIRNLLLGDYVETYLDDIENYCRASNATRLDYERLLNDCDVVERELMRRITNGTAEDMLKHRRQLLVHLAGLHGMRCAIKLTLRPGSISLDQLFTPVIPSRLNPLTADEQIRFNFNSASAASVILIAAAKNDNLNLQGKNLSLTLWLLVYLLGACTWNGLDNKRFQEDLYQFLDAHSPQEAASNFFENITGPMVLERKTTLELLLEQQELTDANFSDILKHMDITTLLAAELSPLLILKVQKHDSITSSDLPNLYLATDSIIAKFIEANRFDLLRPYLEQASATASQSEVMAIFAEFDPNVVAVYLNRDNDFLRCGIKHTTAIDPVTVILKKDAKNSGKHVYERAAILSWCKESKTAQAPMGTDPMTRGIITGLEPLKIDAAQKAAIRKELQEIVAQVPRPSANILKP